MFKRIVCAGFGGQGIMVMGKLISQAAMLEGKEVTWMPSYGAEVRGGTAHSMVTVSDDEISSAAFTLPHDCIIMNRPSLLKFEKRIISGGLMVINSSLVHDEVKRKDITGIKIPATEVAKDLGQIKVANMVILGAYQAITKLVSFSSLVESLEVVIPPHRKNLISLNIKALEKGRVLAGK